MFTVMCEDLERHHLGRKDSTKGAVEAVHGRENMKRKTTEAAINTLRDDWAEETQLK